MRLKQPLLQLPLTFSAETLAAEVDALPGAAWEAHPTGYEGNDAVRLVTPGGELTDALEGAMAPTEFLQSCPYIMQVMAALGGVWGRSRLMRLAPGGEVPAHIDSHYYWRTHLRIHIPVITNPGVRFTCGDETVHMAPGECWVFDSFRWHEVHNDGSEARVHLVLDTVGGERLWDLVSAAQNGSDPVPRLREVLPGQVSADSLAFETINSPKVMSPWEIKTHLAFLSEHVLPDPLLDSVMERLGKFAYAWGAAWARFGPGDEGLPVYRQLLAKVQQDLTRMGGEHISLGNELKLYFVLNQLIFLNAVPRPRAEKLVANTIGVTGQRLAS